MMSQTKIIPFPKERRHTLSFLKHISSYSPVFINTDVDMTNILKVREQTAKETKRKYSIITYVIHEVAQTFQRYPEANSSFSGGLNPKIARYNSVDAKFTLDKKIGQERVVLSALVPDANQLSLRGIQNIIDYYKHNDFEEIQEFNKLKKMQNLPLFLSEMLFKFITENLTKRNRVFGSFSVTSLGHRSVNSFFSIGGTALTFGVGRIQPKPIVLENGEIGIAPLMTLNMTFDHRVIDGAMAADILNEIKEALEVRYSDNNLSCV
ncbi:MAG: 2-oxo acid dehydrogenase subunit E2 [Xenococcaceae cyanobacterium MO_167.B27]|nr:2-oxo acid dehydrogenase subunit E2 [Xenococcaceae cyanobacterium MO_167.B27]